MEAATPDWTILDGEGPLLATAIHAGHALRPEVAACTALADAARLREEDPFTDLWTDCAPTRVVVHTSRFEVDLNRPPASAVYRAPEDAWGLHLWTRPLSEACVQTSLAKHTAYFEALRRLCDERVRRHGHFVLLDLHSYNHLREGPGSPPADPALNPVVNLGTGSLDRVRWGALVDRFVADLRRGGGPVGGPVYGPGEPLDVRENVKFRGGFQSRWVHEHYPGTGCALAVEFKKVFMDEWTGHPDHRAMEHLGQALHATIPGLLASLAGLGR